jgi:hypothetical protein
MLDLLMSFVQCLCVIGYLYGAWLVITHRADAGPMRGRESSLPPRSESADDLAWRRYMAYDW